MKKLIVSLILIISLILPVNGANIMPTSIEHNDLRTIGVYQVPETITLYKSPDENASIINTIKWSSVDIFPEGVKFNELFIVFFPEKELGYVAVTDETDGWVEIIYNNKTGETAWIKKDDPYRFMSWIHFYNMYGRKYGLYILKGAPASVKNIKSAADDSSQFIAEMNMPTKIKLNVIRGNWALVSVLDLDRSPKTGYIRWRGDDGIRYLFPDIK